MKRVKKFKAVTIDETTPHLNNNAKCIFLHLNLHIWF